MTNTDWGQIAALMAVLSGISSLVTWMFMKGLVQPQISKDIEKSMSATRTWVANNFVGKGVFDLHEFKDSQTHQVVTSQIADVVHDQSKTAERVVTLHDKVLILESGREKRS